MHIILVLRTEITRRYFMVSRVMKLLFKAICKQSSSSHHFGVSANSSESVFCRLIFSASLSTVSCAITRPCTTRC